VIASQIVQELAELTAENRKGVEVYAEGSVAERQAHAKLEAADARLERDLAKAQVDRVRAKLRAIESAIMAQATAAKMVQAEMKL